MKLMSITLENFKGIKELHLSFKGESFEIRGANGTGKSTVADAFSWLLTDKPMSGIKNFSPQTLDKDGNAVHRIDCSVEAVLDVGEPLTLKKTLKEKWTKKRGQTSPEFSGRITEYEINGLPKKKGDFTKKISEIIDVEKMQMLSNIKYFSSDMAWKERRKILLDLCGDVTDDDVLKSKAKFTKLADKKGAYTVDEYNAYLTADMKKLNASLNSIPERIDEAEKAKPVVNGEKSEFERMAESLKKKIEKKKAELAAIGHSDAEDRKAEAIGRINSQIALVKSQYDEKQSEEINKFNEARRNLNNRLMDADAEKRQANLNLQELQRRKIVVENDLENMRSSWIESKKEKKIENEKVFDESTNICPTCGQMMPPQMITENMQRFNTNKADMLEKISKRMQEVKVKGQLLASELKEINKEIEDTENRIKAADSAYETAQKALNEFTLSAKKPIPFEMTDEYAALVNEKNNILSLSASDTANEASDKVRKEIADFELDLSNVNECLSSFTIIENQNKRIDELEADMKKKSKQYGIDEKMKQLCEDFTVAKVNMLTDSVNKKFKSVSFRLFETQVNGGLKDCCDVMIPCAGSLVPYADANTASKVNAGIEIISALSKHYGESLPVFIDNAEGVTHIDQPNGMQIIKLIVDDSYKNLTLGVNR